MRPDDSSFPDPQRRVEELAAIFAAGVLRVHVTAAFPASHMVNPLDSKADALDVSPKTVLSVRAG